MLVFLWPEMSDKDNFAYYLEVIIWVSDVEW